MVEPDRPQMAIRRMLYGCWITKAPDTHSEYEIRIAFPQQQRLRECAWMLRLYVHFLSSCILIFGLEEKYVV
jgi:hypothetical protein